MTLDGEDEGLPRVQRERENNQLPTDAEDELLLLTGGLALLPMLFHRPKSPRR
jgi:hypothetical protein